MRLTDVLRLIAGPFLLATLTGASVWVFGTLTQPASPDPGVVYGGPVRFDLQNQGRDTGTGRPRHKEGFVIADLSNRTTSLLPGAVIARWIRLTNPNDFDIRVTNLTATVGNPLDRMNRPVPGCPKANLRVEPLSQPVIVGTKASYDVTLITRLAADAPLACADARFPLTYFGIASKP